MRTTAVHAERFRQGKAGVFLVDGFQCGGIEWPRRFPWLLQVGLWWAFGGPFGC